MLRLDVRDWTTDSLESRLYDTTNVVLLKKKKKGVDDRRAHVNSRERFERMVVTNFFIRPLFFCQVSGREQALVSGEDASRRRMLAVQD